MEYRLKRALTAPLIVLAACVLWFWEWLWEPLERLMARLGRMPVLRLLEARLMRASPYLALACFLIPGAVLLPFKLAGLYFLGHGAPWLGIATFFAAKVVGTALVARIFALTRAQLLQIAWFARSFAWLQGFRERVFVALRSHPAWQQAVATLARLRARLRRVRRGIFYHLRCRWRAIYRLSRRRGRLTCC